MKSWLRVLLVVIGGVVAPPSRAHECGSETRTESGNGSSECDQRTMLDAWLNGDSVLADWQNMQLC